MSKPQLELALKQSTNTDDYLAVFNALDEAIQHNLNPRQIVFLYRHIIKEAAEGLEAEALCSLR